MNRNNTRHSWMARAECAVRLGLCLACVLLLVLTTGVQAQESPFEKARSVYNTGEYGQAAELFTALAHDETVNVEIRKEALRYLGRAHIARSLYTEAHKAVVDLLDLEPPLAELDPDVEPDTVMYFYYKERKKRSGYEVPKADPGLRTLAVMDFRNYAFDDKDQWDPMQWGFSSMMIEQLSGATDMRLVERENLQYILDELDLQKEPGRVDQSTAVRMGKMLGAHAMVFGGIYVTGKRLRLSARVVKVETSEILLGESIEGKVKDFYELLEKLSLKVARSVNSTLTETEIGARTETKSLDASMAYSRGLKLAEQRNYAAAYDKFMEALDYDPSYTRAQRKADSLVPILAAIANTEGSGSSGESGAPR